MQNIRIGLIVSTADTTTRISTKVRRKTLYTFQTCPRRAQRGRAIVDFDAGTGAENALSVTDQVFDALHGEDDRGRDHPVHRLGLLFVSVAKKLIGAYGMVILTLSFIGVCSLRNSVVDCTIGEGFGVLGLVLKRSNLTFVPIVLGGIMEVKLRSAMIRVKDPMDFVERPIAAILAIPIVLVIVMHIRTLRQEHKARLAESEIDHEMHDTQRR